MCNVVGQCGTDIYTYKILLKDELIAKYYSMNHSDSFSQRLKQESSIENHHLENESNYPSNTETIVTKSKKSTVNLSVDTNLIHELKEESKGKGQV